MMPPPETLDAWFDDRRHRADAAPAPTRVRNLRIVPTLAPASDAGARRALVDGGKSLLPAGVREIEGGFDVDATVEIVDEQGAVFAKGLCRYTSESLRTYRGKRTADLPEGLPHEVVHRDDLVVLP